MTAALPVTITKSILTHLPPLATAFVYGSAAFKQANNYSKHNMLDMILVVDDLKEFHTKNLQKNPSHYSYIRAFGPRFVSAVNDLPAFVYFNTAIRVEDQFVKYGVISKDKLISDLLDWDVLYVAGRMHKPISYIKETDPEVNMAQDMNLRSALHTVLLTLPETFSLRDLFIQITRLSYDGDFRMIFGEDKNKVANIVKPALAEFEAIYCPLLKSMSILELSSEASRVHQDHSQAARVHHLELLPKSIQHHLMLKWRSGEDRHKDVEDVLKSIAKNHPSLCAEVVQKSVQAVVRRSAIKQSLKGLMTSGPLTAISYASAKVKKMFSSLRQAEY